MKYKLTDETILYKYNNTIKLYRIEALKDFSDVKAGDKGGFVQSENNLSQYGNCWIYDDAIVMGDARIMHNAKILDDAIITDNAKIYGQAIIYDTCYVCDNAKVFGNCHCFCDAVIKDNARIHGKAKVHVNAMIRNNAEVCGTADIYDDEIGENILINK